MRKTLAIIMMIAMVFCYMPLTGFADTEVSTTSVNTSGFIDMPNNWSTEALSKAVGNGLLEGFKEKSGTFIKPSDPLTRAQMATIVNRAFGAKGTANLTGVKDVPQKAWYTAEMQKAVKMGTMKLDSKMRPNDPITRQEAFTVLARAFKMADGTMANLEKFSDKEKVSSWAVSSLGALARVGYIQGADGKLNPLSKITRAEFAVVMDNMIKEYINKAGTVTQVHEGNLMINVPDVILKDITVKGDLILGDGIGEGNVSLENVIVKGNLIARGGGVDSIVINGGSIEGKVVIAKVDGQIRVFVNGAQVEMVVIDDGKDDIIVEGTVGTLEITAPDVPVVLNNATVNTITVNTEGPANLQVGAGSTVTNVVVGTGSTGTTLNVEGTVTNVETSAANTNVGGTGTVTTVTTNEGANNTSVTTPSTKVNNDGATGVTAGGGTEVPSGSTATNSNTGGEATIQPTTGGTTGGGGGTAQDTTAPTLVEVTLESDEASNLILIVTASDNAGLASLEVDHSLEGILPEFTVGTNAATDPETGASSTFADETWTLNFGPTVSAIMRGSDTITFYFVITDVNGNEFGSMSPTTPENTRAFNIPADLTAYEAALAAVTEADYTEASWATYQEVVAANVVTVENTQAEVDAAEAAITAAQAYLVFEGKAGLDTAKGTAAGLTEADYTAASWADLTTALALPETTNAEVVTKTTAINSAIENLQLILSYNGSVSGQITSSDSGVVNGTLDFEGEDDLIIEGNVTGIGNLTTFIGTVSGSINGTITAQINANGIDTLSGTITPSSGVVDGTIRIIGIFGQTGIDGDFEGEIITGPVPTYVETLEITSAAGSTVTVGDTLQLGINVTPEAASAEVAWSVYVNDREKGSIDETGLFTATAEGTVTVIAKALDGSLKDDTFVVDIVLPDQSGSPALTLGTPPTYGSELTVGEGTLTTTTNLTYTWYRSDNATYEEGTDISVGTGTTYTPVADDIGKYLIVVATSTDANGYGIVATPEEVVDPVVAIAAGITSIPAPAQDQTQIVFPDVPDGYTIAIKSSSTISVIGLDGIIHPEKDGWFVRLVLTVTNTATGNYADTTYNSDTVGGIVVTVPGNSAGIQADKITAESLGTITMGDAVLQKAQTLVSEGYTVTAKAADGTYIDNSGEAIAVGEGTITFTITKDANDAITADTDSLSITVNAATVAVTGVTLDQATMTLTAGGATGTITATVLPADATNKTVTWTSSNEAVATVADGVVTPVATGTTTITVTTEDGSSTATCVVTVELADADLLARVNASQLRITEENQAEDAIGDLLTEYYDLTAT